MDYKYLLMFFAVNICSSVAQHENIPYENVKEICDSCICLESLDLNNHIHKALNCASKNFEHILPRWPTQFGTNHNGIDIVATFSRNNIKVLQQLPATNATLTFSCRHCKIKELQVPTFLDVPNIVRLDLSWNEIQSSKLVPELFRGPFRGRSYDAIALIDLDLSHNAIHTFDKKLFIFTPYLKILNVGHNQFKVLDSTTVMALTSAKELEKLDLSYNGLGTIDSQVFKLLTNLNTLNLAGNNFHVLPPDLRLLKNLVNFNFADNQIIKMDQSSFAGLTSLMQFNISYMPNLKTVNFSYLPALEQLYCSHNPKLEELDLTGLRPSFNLTYLDLSYCALNTFTFHTEVEPQSKLQTWPNLLSFKISGNPFYCGCELMQTLELIGVQDRLLAEADESRCETPYILAGTLLTNLTASKICSMQIPKKYRVIEDDPPRFLRRRYIILTAVIASIALVFGLIVGFIVVCIRRRLKDNSFGIEPIRYTSVRGSNLSAFASVPAPVIRTGVSNA